MIPLTGWGRFLTSYATYEVSHGRVHDIVIIYEYIKLFNGDFLRCKGHQVVSLL